MTRHNLSDRARNLRLQWMPAIRWRIFASASTFPKRQNGRDCIYLCGHSLGLQPKTARLSSRAGIAGLGRTGSGRTFSREESVDAVSPAADRADCRAGGSAAGEVVVMNSLTVNLHLMMASFYRPTAQTTQDSGRARSVSFGSVCGEVADSFSWI